MPPMWLRLGLEQPGPIKGCGEKDCLPEGVDPVDNYCERHGNFLPGTPGKGRAFLLNACRVVICLVFWVAAESGSALPLLMTGMVIGGFVLLLPLRHYPAARTFALVAWVIAVVAAIASRHLADPERLTVGLVLAGFAACYTLVYTTGLTMVGGPRRSTDVPDPDAAAAGVVAGLSAIAAVLGAGQIAFWIWSNVERPVLGTLALATLVIVALIVAVHSLVDAGHRPGPPIKPLVWVPPPPAAWRWTVSDRSATLAQRPDAVDRIGRVLVAFADSVIRLLRTLFWFAVRTILATVNLGHRIVIRTLRYLRSAFAKAMVIAGRAIRIGFVSLVHSITVVFLPLALLLAAAYILDVWAITSAYYASHSTPLNLGVQLLNGAGAVATLTLTWMILSGEAPRAVFSSAGRAMSIAGANLLVLIAAGGWAVGLLSLLTEGRVRPGYATVGSTVILVIVTIWSRLRRRGAGQTDLAPANPTDGPQD